MKDGITRRTAASSLAVVSASPFSNVALFTANLAKGERSILNHVRSPSEYEGLSAAPNHDDLFLRFIQAGGGLVPWLGFTWKLSRRFDSENWPKIGGKIRIEPNPDENEETINYSGPQPRNETGQKWGIFEPRSNWHVLSAREFFPVIVKNVINNANLWVIVFRGAYDFSVNDMMGWNCNIIRTTSSVENYEDVVLNHNKDRGNENCSADFQIIRCSAKYDNLPPENHDGAICCHYSRDGEIIGGSVDRAAHGFMFWGGDARTDGLGQGHLWSNQRKCLRLTVKNVQSSDVKGCFCWGSMGEKIEFIDCFGSRCGDVGFDFEGSIDCSARNCHAIDAKNGNYTVFFHCDNITFDQCVSITNDYNFPLFRMYTISQDNTQNRTVTIRGGRWINNDEGGIGVIETRYGCCQNLEISGLTLSNVRIDTAYLNAHNTRLIDNKLRFSNSSPYKFSAIRVGFAKSLINDSKVVSGRTEIIGNSIFTKFEQSVNRLPYGKAGDYGSCGIDLIEDDYNSSASSIIKNNVVSDGFLTSVLIRGQSSSLGVIPQVTCENNVLGVHSSDQHRLIFVTNDYDGINSPVVLFFGNRSVSGQKIEGPKVGSERQTK